MKRAIFILAALLLSAAVLVAGAPLLVSADSVRQEVSHRLEELTGYEVAIRGETRLRLFPTLRFSIEDVTLRAPDAADAPDVAQVALLSGGIELLPLITGEIDVAQFSLTRPEFTLVIDEAGRRNWVTGEGRLEDAIRRTGDGVFRNVGFGEVLITEGALSYADHRTGAARRVTAIDARLSWPSLAAAMEGAGTAVWRGEIIGFALAAQSPIALLGGGSSPASLELRPPMAKINFDGLAHGSDGVQLEGEVAVSAGSTRRLLRWFGADIGEGTGLEELELTGSLSLVGETASLSELSMALDGNHGVGSLQISAASGTVDLGGTLAFEALDLNRYIAGAPGSPAGEADADTPQALAKRIDLSDLEKIVADIRISAESVTIGSLALQRSAATVTVRDGVVTLGIGETAIYGGTASGTARARQTAGGARTEIDLTLSEIESRPLLKALAGTERLDGTASAVLHLSGTGRTLSQMLRDASGQAQLQVLNGTLNGIDIRRLIGALGAGRMEGWPAGEEARTVFGDAGASFRIESGTAATEDFRLVGRNLDIAAEAEISLAAASIAGNGVARIGGEASGQPAFELPFVIEGPVTRPAIYPDPVWVLSRATESPDGIEELRRQFEERGGAESIDEWMRRGTGVLPGLFGGR